YETGLGKPTCEWVCFEHTGYPREKAVAWWRRRSRLPVPATAQEAVELANQGALAPTTAITVYTERETFYECVRGYELGPVPDPLAALALAATRGTDAA